MFFMPVLLIRGQERLGSGFQRSWLSEWEWRENGKSPLFADQGVYCAGMLAISQE